MSNIVDHGVVALIIKDNKLLLLEDSRDLMKGFWGPPHGRCELSDEVEENSVKREVLEETGLHVNPIRRLWTTEADIKTKTISFWLTEFINKNEKLQIDQLESSRAGWFTLDEALTLKLYPGTQKFLTLVKEKKIELF